MKLKITVDGKVYEVDVEASEEAPRRTAPVAGATPRAVPGAPPVVGAPQSSTSVSDESKVCRSPVAGVVVKVTAQVGQAIQANDVLMVLEAMKMETSISSPVAGKVARVNVGVGDPVQGGQVLVEFE
jgi:methylmalonyl-CoA carboxyltransferase small subunit